MRHKLMDIVRNGKVQITAGIEYKDEQRVLRWFGHVWRAGKPIRWIDGVKVGLCSRGMTVETAKKCARGSKKWRALADM